MKTVTFLSDFGTKDHYVAAVKAVFCNLKPDFQIIDISHSIEVCNIIEAAYVLKSVYQDFPKGSIHLVAVGTSLAQKGQFLAVNLNEHIFILPDNGLLNLISSQQPSQIIILPTPKNLTTSFPSKTVLAPAVSKLLQGVSMGKLGKKIDSVYSYKVPSVSLSDKVIKGSVVYIDGNGNAITNISEAIFIEMKKEKSFVVKFTREKFQKICNSYQDREMGDCVLFFNDNGKLEIAINQGNAAELLGLKYGSTVLIDFK